MEQNKYQGRQELPSKVTGTIDRILEEMRIEGISVLEFPEQFLAVLLIEIVCKLRENRWRENPFLYEEGRAEAVWTFNEIRHNARKNPGFSKVLDGVLLISSRQILMNLWELGGRLCAIYSELELELELSYKKHREFRFQTLAGVMDYLVDAIHHIGNKEFFFTPYNLATFVAELVRSQKMKKPGYGAICPY